MSRSEPHESPVTGHKLRLYTTVDGIVRKPWMYNIIAEHNSTNPTKGPGAYMHWIEWNRDMAAKYNATYNSWNDYYEFTDEHDMTFFLLRWS